MATLQKIRNRAGLLVGVIFVALLAFILGDFLNSGGTLFNKFKDKAFSVDGDVVPTGDYQKRIVEFEEFQKMISGQNSLDENISNQIREYVYEQMVKEKIMDAKTKDLGIAVSQEELNDMVYGENVSPVLMQMPFFVDPQTRQFNKEQLNEFMTFIHTDINALPVEQQQQHLMFTSAWMIIQRMMKYQRLEDKYNTLLSSAITANDSEVNANLEDTKANADIAYIISRYSLLPDTAFSVSDDEVAKLYNERKNNYKLNTNLAKISYFAKDILPSEEDFNAIQTEMQQVRESLQTSDNPAMLVADYSEAPYQDIFVSESSLAGTPKTFVASAAVGDVYGPERTGNMYSLYKLVDKTIAPDSVNLRLISIPLSDTTVANHIADSLLNVITTEKEFSVVASELNPQSNGGEVGWVTEQGLATMGAESLIQGCFNGTKGEVLKLDLNGVVCLVKIEDIKQPVSKVKLATIQMSVPVSDKTLLSIDSELDQFVASLTKDTDFNKVVNEKGYVLMTGQTISPSNFDINMISGSRQIVSWAFNEKVGSVKKFDLTNQRVIAKIDEQIEAGYQPIADVLSSALKNELIKNKKAEKIIADLKAKNLANLDAYAQAMNTRVDTVRFVNFGTSNITGLGIEPVLSVSSKYSEVNKLEGPVKGSAGVLVYSITNRMETTAARDITTAKMQLERTYSYRINPMSLFEVQKEKMHVEDNRVAFF